MDEWEQVHELAQQWISEKRKNVTVRLTHGYDSKELQSSDDSSTDESTHEAEADESSDEEEQQQQSPKKSKKRRHRLDETSDSDSSTTSSSSSSSDNRRKKKKKTDKKGGKQRKSSSVTAKQKEHSKKMRRLEKKQGGYGHDLMKRWLCDTQACVNRTHYCWQPEGVGGLHYTLHSEIINRWSKAMTRQECTVSDPAQHIKDQLFA